MTKAYAVVMEDENEASYAFAFTLGESETPEGVGKKLAEDHEMRLLEVVPVEDYIGKGVFELCANG